MKKMILKLSLFLPIFLIVVLVNYKRDPANIFSKTAITEAVDMLNAGYHVLGLTDYNERLFQETFIKSRKNSPEVIALGSSRIMGLTQDMVGKDFLNHGMSGAGIYDYMGILGIYKSENMLPKEVVIGVDPWIFNAGNGEARWMELSDYIKIFEDDSKSTVRFMGFEDNVNKLSQLISPAYFQASLKVTQKENGKTLVSTTLSEGDTNIKRKDGSVSYDTKFTSRPLKEVNEAAQAFVSNGSVYQLETYTELDSSLKEKFEFLMAYLSDHKVRVILYLPPYHPVVYQYLSSHREYDMILSAEKYFRDYALEHKLDVYGSYDPKYSGCQDKDFLDGMHLREEAYQKAFKYMGSSP